MKSNINSVVMIKGDEKNREKRKIGIIKNIFMGKDNTIQSIRTRKIIIERQIQLLYPMELHSDSNTITCNTQDDETLNVNAKEFRPKTSAAAVIKQRIKNITDNKNQ